MQYNPEYPTVRYPTSRLIRHSHTTCCLQFVLRAHARTLAFFGRTKKGGFKYFAPADLAVS